MDWVTLALSLLGLMGIGKLLQMAYKAMLERREVRRKLDQTNAGKEVDADVNAFNSISKRLELVESRFDLIQSQFTEQKVENAKLEAENARLSKDNERQEKEIERQRERLHGLAENLQQKDAQILKLTLAVEHQQKEIEDLRAYINGNNSEDELPKTIAVVDDVIKVELVEPEE